MSNSDTIFSLQGLGAGAGAPRNQLAAVTALGTTETLLTMGADSGTNVTAFMPFPGQSDITGSYSPTDPNANASILLDNTGSKVGSNRGSSRPYYQQLSFSGRGIRIRLQGRFVSSAALNGMLFKFYVNTKAAGAVTAGAGVASSIATGNTIPTATTSSFIAEATVMWDSTSNLMFGAEAWAAAAGVYGARVAGNATPFTVTAPISNYLMFASITFTTGAANAITPIEFAFEDI
jgi:hypothetical protein